MLVLLVMFKQLVASAPSTTQAPHGSARAVEQYSCGLAFCPRQHVVPHTEQRGCTLMRAAVCLWRWRSMPRSHTRLAA
ncbi:hypothetical protein V8C86DRAFT_2749720 [Haematococcus lacustris]